VKLAATGFQLRWQSLSEDPSRTAKRASKTKYTCPECEQNAWAKSDALLICGRCYEEDDGEIHLMIPESAGDSKAA
jgi:hypothetical protein